MDRYVPWGAQRRGKTVILLLRGGKRRSGRGGWDCNPFHCVEAVGWEEEVFNHHKSLQQGLYCKRQYSECNVHNIQQALNEEEMKMAYLPYKFGTIYPNCCLPNCWPSGKLGTDERDVSMAMDPLRAFCSALPGTQCQPLYGDILKVNKYFLSYILYF